MQFRAALTKLSCARAASTTTARMRLGPVPQEAGRHCARSGSVKPELLWYSPTGPSAQTVGGTLSRQPRVS